MKTEHLFLSCPTVAATGRWVEAFASGESMELPALQVRLRRSAPEHCMIWLSSSDPQWPDHLQQVFHIRPEFRVVVLSNAPDPDEGLNALNRGARGYTHAYAVAALLREVALVVEHGERAIGSCEAIGHEERVRRDRAARVDARGHGGGNGRRNHIDLLAPEVAGFSAVRVQARHQDARARDAKALAQVVVKDFQGSNQAFARNGGGDIHEGQVRSG